MKKNKFFIFIKKWYQTQDSLWCLQLPLLQQLQDKCGGANWTACDQLWGGEGPAFSGFIQLPVQLRTWPWDDITVWPAQDPAADPHPLPAGKTPHHPHSESPSMVRIKQTDPYRLSQACTVHYSLDCAPPWQGTNTLYFVWPGLFWAVILNCT